MLKLKRKISNLYYNIKNFSYNLKWMIPAAWEFRCWDSHYNITLFCKSLEVTAHTIKKYGNHVNKEKDYRRCLTAAALLKQAYSFNELNDKSYKDLFNNLTFSFIDIGNGMQQMHTDYKNIGEEYYKKKSKIIRKRLAKEEKDLKENAWKYIHKYILHFWD